MWNCRDLSIYLWPDMTGSVMRRWVWAWHRYEGGALKTAENLKLVAAVNYRAQVRALTKNLAVDRPTLLKIGLVESEEELAPSARHYCRREEYYKGW